jgi:hypothetical protein
VHARHVREGSELRTPISCASNSGTAVAGWVVLPVHPCAHRWRAPSGPGSWSLVCCCCCCSSSQPEGSGTGAGFSRAGRCPANCRGCCHQQAGALLNCARRSPLLLLLSAAPLTLARCNCVSQALAGLCGLLIVAVQLLGSSPGAALRRAAQQGRGRTAGCARRRAPSVPATGRAPSARCCARLLSPY